MLQVITQTLAPTTPPWPVQYAPAFSAVAVVLVGLVAATIAHRQAVTARTKLQLDLYDKRRPIYVTARNVIFCVEERDLDKVRLVLRHFQEARIDAPFLFDQGVADWMEILIAAVDDRLELETPAARLYPGPEAVQPRREWIDHWLGELKLVFAPYLKLETRRAHVGHRSNAMPGAFRG
jgi:hypothetical protein